MKALVIYDTTGRIWSIVYGEQTAPQGLQCMWVDIPDGASLERIDVTDTNNPQPVYSYLPESDIGRLQARTEELERQHEAGQEEVTALQLALAEQYESNLALAEEITNTQMALIEIYEGMEV